MDVLSGDQASYKPSKPCPGLVPELLSTFVRSRARLCVCVFKDRIKPHRQSQSYATNAPFTGRSEFRRHRTTKIGNFALCPSTLSQHSTTHNYSSTLNRSPQQRAHTGDIFFIFLKNIRSLPSVVIRFQSWHKFVCRRNSDHRVPVPLHACGNAYRLVPHPTASVGHHFFA
jgi:hypothetical protein